MFKYYVFLVLLTMLGSGGAFFLKKASTEATSIKKLILGKYMYMGALLYFISGILNIYVLQFLPFTTVLPLTSITYIWTLILAHRYYDELINGNKILGICCIIIGSFIIGLS